VKIKAFQPDAEAFRGFGRSIVWPFRSRLKALSVGKELADVRGLIRESCPARSGVYGMLDRRGQLIYVGMSTSLRKRLITYFQGGAAIRKECRIAKDTKQLVWEVVGHELAAQLRELDLIRRYQPRFNVKGRQPDRPLGYIFISREEAPRIRTGRRVPKGVRFSWGPLVINWRIKEAIEVLNRSFKLVDCSASVPIHFADQGNLFSLELRPECLRHEMGTCLAPCAAQCTRAEYLTQLRSARAFLDGRDCEVLESLESQLQDAAEHCRYEQAANVRDRLGRLRYLDERLECLRAPALPPRFVYPVRAGQKRVWYLLAEGRVIAGVRTPNTERDASICLERVKRVYDGFRGGEEATDRPARQIVSSWFRTRRDELSSILSPEAAEEFCRRLQTG
jgi:excinuclease ABC subunit C